MRRRAEPVDERGGLKEAIAIPENSPRDPGDVKDGVHLPAMPFPSDRLPPLEVKVVRRLPGVAMSPEADGPDSSVNHNQDPSLPMPVVPAKTMINLWQDSDMQTEVTWSKPENIGNFSGMIYQIQLKIGNGDWLDLNENRQPLYRVYFVDGVVIFGRQRLTQNSNVQVARLRIRPVGEIYDKGNVNKKYGPWSPDILFSLEGTGQKEL